MTAANVQRLVRQLDSRLRLAPPDLVTQMQNARGAFYKHATPCSCGDKPRLIPHPLNGEVGFRQAWWCACPNGCRKTMAYSTPGEADFAWNNPNTKDRAED